MLQVSWVPGLLSAGVQRPHLPRVTGTCDHTDPGSREKHACLSGE